MSDSLDHVRAEIKRWEREFASTHGRDPSVQDIRDQPLIADKYKLYKKLSKAVLPASRPAQVPPVPRSNPFSPAKKPLRSPNPFATPTKVLPSQHSSAVSRARKRLRGEPVSPSPTKSKRPRVRSHQDSSSDSDEAGHELPQPDHTPFFVADSPVKAPAGGKSFKLLFDDALPALSIPKNPPYLDFPPHSRDAATTSLVPPKLFPSKDTGTSSHDPTFPANVPQSRTSAKRVLDCGELVTEHPQYPLVSPSPPPQDSSSRDLGKAKAKTVPSRKKFRVQGEKRDQDVDSSDDDAFKVTTVTLDRDKRPPQHAHGLDWDPLLHLGARNHDPGASREIDANHHASGTFTVDLPDKLRRVLAISPSRNQNNTEERVVRGLLSGGPVGHYDPSRGGDIWHVGEADDATYRDLETEDDWESEPVPWEVGEL